MAWPWFNCEAVHQRKATLAADRTSAPILPLQAGEAMAIRGIHFTRVDNPHGIDSALTQILRAGTAEYRRSSTRGGEAARNHLPIAGSLASYSPFCCLALDKSRWSVGQNIVELAEIVAPP